MKYTFICNNCGCKHFTDGDVENELVEIKSTPLPKNANGTSKDTIQLQKKFKCNKCGYVLKMIKNIADKQEKPKEDFKEISTDQYLSQWQNEILRSVRKKS